MSDSGVNKGAGSVPKERLWNVRVPLQASDPASPTLPAWGAFTLSGIIVFPAMGLIGILFDQVFGTLAVGALALLLVPVVGVLLARRRKCIKLVKSGLDALWSAWTFMGMAFAASAAIGGVKFDDALNQFATHWVGGTLIVVAVMTAAGRVAMPFVEAWTNRAAAQPKLAQASAPPGRSSGGS